MPRQPREDVPGATHHVIAKGNASAAIISDDWDREVFVRLLRQTVARHSWSCIAYCLLDTHLHLVVTTPEPNLGIGMKWLLGAHARSFNQRHGRQGHLFRARFYSKRITSESHFVSTIVYVALNPVRAGAVNRPELWRWSSYAAMIGENRPLDFIDVSAALSAIDSDPRTARRRLRTAVQDGLELDRRMAGV